MDYEKLHICMSGASRSKCGAVQVATRCFLLLFSLGLLLGVLDRRSGDGGRGIWIGKAPLGIWVRQAGSLLRRWRCHDVVMRKQVRLCARTRSVVFVGVAEGE